MSEDNLIKNTNDPQNNDLLEEFENLILNVSKEIIDQTIMGDLKILRQDLTEEINNFAEKSTKINFMTISMDNLLSQTTENLTSVVKKTSSELNGFLENTSSKFDERIVDITRQMNDAFDKTYESLSVKLSEVTQSLNQMMQESILDLDNRLNGASTRLESLVGHKQTDIQVQMAEHASVMSTMLDEAKEHIQSIARRMPGDVEHLIEKMNHNLESSLIVAKESMKEISNETIDTLKNNNIHMDRLLESTHIKMETLLRNTQNNMTEDVDRIKDLLKYSDQITRSSLKSIEGVQEDLEKLLTRTSKDIFSLIELDNTINIKVDHGLSKIKAHAEKNDKRFMVFMVMNGVSLVGIMALFILILLRG